jgi:cell division protein ZapA
MAELDVRIGGRKYELACRDGDEDRLQTLARMVDAKAAEAARSMGGLTETRQLLFAALLLADQLNEELAKPAPEPAPPPEPEPPVIVELDPAIALAIEEAAARIEILAVRLENSVADA